MAQFTSEVEEIREIKAKHDIRHSLAIDRTILANERTLLSYTRTALTLILAGVSFLHFTSELSMHILGWLFIPIGLLTFLLGYYRFHKKKTAIRKEKDAVDLMLKNEYCNIP